MLHCLFSSDTAKETRKILYDRFIEDKKIKRIDHDSFNRLCQSLVIDYERDIFSYDDQENLILVNVNDDIRMEHLDEFESLDEDKLHTFDDLQFIIDICDQIGDIKGLDKMKDALKGTRFHISYKSSFDLSLNHLSSSVFQHHYWHVSRKSSLDTFYNILRIIKDSYDEQDEFSEPLNLNSITSDVYQDLIDFMKDTVPDLFITVGEIDFSDQNFRSLPIIIQSNRFAKDSPEQYYNRLMDYGYDHHWCLSSTVTEINDLIAFMSGHFVPRKTFTNVFEFEFFRIPRQGIPDFHYKKYSGSNVMLLQHKDNEYQFEFIKGNVKDFRESYTGVLDYEDF